MIDQKAIEEHIRGILIALGEDPDRLQKIFYVKAGTRGENVR